MRLIVQDTPFDLAAELETFGQDSLTGAVVSFTGRVRDDTGTLEALELEHYPGMTERAFAQIAETAQRRWQLTDLTIIHRVGRLAPGEPIMMVATASPHRKAAFEAAEYLMDFLKSRAPFWKKEHFSDHSKWVSAKQNDEDALSRW
ncbi:molybdenum cofactor biosynthesis protein MoaE [Thioclava litoralis]|uniref:Molybdopterin synthase catalytic subunit n=1 Tax=Thioclava litoralis TaxID=3076557 RepID=A0ABZ1E398_9RHOB|nr:molybdenum cofactor biosynthesis protein MoaE [Thioclava sp. FTW29]